MASRAIDRLPYRGRKAETDQEHAFPRCYTASARMVAGPLDRRLVMRGYWYCEEEVPQAVLDAVCEEAIALLERGDSERLRLQREGVSSFSLGGLSESYRAGAERRKLLSAEAHELLRPYMAASVAIA